MNRVPSSRRPPLPPQPFHSAPPNMLRPKDEDDRARDPDGDMAVAHVLESFLADLERGRPADPVRVLAENPAISDRLRACLEVLQIATPQDDGGPLHFPGGGLLERSLDDYELLDEIARGGMGVVYRARQRSLNRLVAVKLISTSVLAAPDPVRRFRAEAEALALLDHPRIVPIYEFGEAEGVCYFSMRLLTNGSLADRLADYAAAPRAAAVLIGQVARAIHHAHRRGVLHRDLKPSNILLDADGQPQIADFGLAKRLGAEADLSSTGMVIGTPSFMAPEQAERQLAAVTAASDIYGLGAILYAMLTEKPPVDGESLTEILLRLRERPPAPPCRLNPRVDRRLEAICLKCLEKEPGRRYGTAAELADDLDRYLGGQPVQALPRRRLPTPGIANRLRFPRPFPIAGLVAVLLGLVLLTPVSRIDAVPGLQLSRIGQPRPWAYPLLQHLVGLDLLMMGIGWSTLRNRAWSLGSSLYVSTIALLLLSSHLLSLLTADAWSPADDSTRPLRLELDNSWPLLGLLLLGSFALGLRASSSFEFFTRRQTHGRRQHRPER